MARDRRAFLWDIIQAANDIQSFVNRKKIEDYESNPMLRAAVERKLEIIGEALSQGLHHFPDFAARIGDCTKIVAFRYRLIHGYNVVSNALVWDVVRHDIPILQNEVERLLQEADKKQI